MLASEAAATSSQQFHLNPLAFQNRKNKLLVNPYLAFSPRDTSAATLTDS